MNKVSQKHQRRPPAFSRSSGPQAPGVDEASVWLVFKDWIPCFTWKHGRPQCIQVKSLGSGRCYGSCVQLVMMENAVTSNFRGRRVVVCVFRASLGERLAWFRNETLGQRRNFSVLKLLMEQFPPEMVRHYYSAERGAIWPPSGIWRKDHHVRSLSQFWCISFSK